MAEPARRERGEPGTPDAAGIRTLVVAPSWVGDLVLALPVLEALAASGREVVVLARPHLAPLLRLVPAVRGIVERAPDEATTIARLRAAGAGEAVVLPGSVGSAWLPFRAGIPYRWGYGGRLRWELLARRPWPHVGRFLGWATASLPRTALLRPAVRPPRRRRHQAMDYAELLEAMRVSPPADWRPRLALAPERRARGRELLRRARIEPEGGPIVGLFPGAEFGPSKRWPWPRFAALARELRRAVPGVRVAIVAGPKEVWLAVRIHEESGHFHPVIGPDLDLTDLAAVLGALDLLVTNDSGPMHLAAALGRPCVALFGPTDPTRTAPAGPGHQVLRTGIWCSPCLRRRCPLVHHRCLRGIGVDEVLAACRTALGGGA